MCASRWKWKTRKIIIHPPVPSYESLVSVKENTDRKKRNKKNKERKKKNIYKTQNKLNSPHVCIMLKYYPNN